MSLRFLARTSSAMYRGGKLEGPSLDLKRRVCVSCVGDAFPGTTIE